MSDGADGPETPSTSDSPSRQPPPEPTEPADEGRDKDRRPRLLPVWLLLGAAAVSGGAWAVTEHLGAGRAAARRGLRAAHHRIGRVLEGPSRRSGRAGDPEPGHVDLRDTDDGRSGGSTGAGLAAAGRAAEPAATGSRWNRRAGVDGGRHGKPVCPGAGDRRSRSPQRSTKRPRPIPWRPTPCWSRKRLQRSPACRNPPRTARRCRQRSPQRRRPPWSR